VGSGIGMINLGGQWAGFIAPLIMGLLVTQFGTYDAAFDFLLAMTLFATLVALTVRTGSTAALTVKGVPTAA
jgi:nitrate/nitrite transporter NarK